MAAQFSVKDHKPWKAGFFTIMMTSSGIVQAFFGRMNEIDKPPEARFRLLLFCRSDWQDLPRLRSRPIRNPLCQTRPYVGPEEQNHQYQAGDGRQREE